MEPSPNVKAIFDEALEIETPDERRAYLDRACGEAPGLREKVEALLKAYADAGSFLQSSPARLIGTVDELPTRERAGMAIGPYKLIEPIGEGGMGTVYMAQQARPVRRLVALKLIKPGMDSQQVIARFEAERQALALMDHPNIARVLDAGTTESGRPYFVMELVKGTPLIKYCDEHKLTPRQRLELFVPVCQAVQHAHQKGIIHRDLKPSNVLVAPYDGKPIPKVIDFGVAKATGQQLTDRTLVTGFGAVVGTLEYMSPEQAELNNHDIDTRSDIYSLGVLLYELLTGTTPLEHGRLKESSLLEALRLIREEEPPRPSRRLSATRELPVIAANRGLEPKRLSGLLRGELDWIVMKCLDKDRSRRYETASTLAADLQRYLNDEPVQACPPSVSYRFRKFARRNRPALLMASVVALALVLVVVGLAISTLLAWQAKNELEQNLYFQRIALAEREWFSNNLGRTEELLALCPPTMRGWEWHYLKRLRGKPLPPLRHDAGVFSCAISPDGRQIASAGGDGFLTLWDLSTGQRLHRFGDHDKPWLFVAFSPDGRQIASGDLERTVKVWDASTGQQLLKWDTRGGYVQDLAFCPDGRLLVCSDEADPGGSDVRIWDVLAGKELFALPGDDHIVSRLAVSHDGKVFASAGLDHTVRLWDLRTGEPLRTLRGEARFWSVAFSPDGRWVAASTGTQDDRTSGQIKIWEVATGREYRTLPGHGARSIAFSPDGRRLATGGIDEAVKLWDTASGQEILTLRGHTDWVWHVAFTPDGHHLVSASEDRTVRIWDGRPWREEDGHGEELLTLHGHTNSVNAVAFHPGGTTLATGSSDGTIRTWDAHTGRMLRTLPVDLYNVQSVAFSPDGTLLAAGGTRGKGLTVLDPTTGQERGRLAERTSNVHSVAFSPDGKRLASGDEDGRVLICDVATGAVRHRLRGHTWSVFNVAFSPDPEGRLLASTDTNDGSVRVWETSSGREIASSPLRHQGVIYGVAFSPDGRLLASAGWDRTVRLWDTETWKQVEVVLDATTGMQRLAFSPDGRLLAWGANDSTVKVWRRATGEIRVLRGHLNRIRAVAFNPDGKRLASASQDGTVKIWETP